MKERDKRTRIDRAPGQVHTKEEKEKALWHYYVHVWLNDFGKVVLPRSRLALGWWNSSNGAAFAQ